MPDGPGVTTRLAQLAVFNEAVGAGGSYEDFKLGLYQNDLIPTSATLLADLAVATFGGYALLAAQAFTAAYVGPDGRTHLTGPGVLFEATTSATPNTIFGWYIANTAGTGLLAAYRLPAPVNIINAGDGVWISPDVVWGS